MKFPELPPDSSIDFEKEGEKFAKLMAKAEVKEVLKKYFSDYPYWSAFKYKKLPEGIEPQFMWKLLKMGRDSTAIPLQISEVHGFRFKLNITPDSQALLHQFDLNLVGMSNNAQRLSNDEKGRYLLSSIMEEAIASSQLEGASTTRIVAKEMLLVERKPRNKSERMISNNYLTIKELNKLKDQKLTPELIKYIHSVITKDTLDEKLSVGEFRKNNEVDVVDVVTGEVFYSPPDFGHLEKLIDDYCRFANLEKDEVFIHPIVRASILHFLMGYIHPFVDGNGRTARALFYWYLLSKGYWLMGYMSISRIIIDSPTQYAKAYLHTELDENDLTYFVNYQLRTLDKALKELQIYIDRKIKEKKELFALAKSGELNERQIEILNDFTKDPNKVMAIKEVQTKYGVVYQTARTDLFGLVEMGFLEQKKMGKKLMFFVGEGFGGRMKDLEK